MKRKITSILAADVVEFSRLVAQDEEDTLARLVSAQAVFGSHVSSHGGRIFNTAGDAILAEFPSAVEAVRAGLAIQAGWFAVDCDAPDERRLWFRMGIGIGDVMEHGADLLGDGVNIAARLQGLAPAGGIAISHWVQEQIAGKVVLPLIDIGEQDLKNIPKPVRVSIIDPSGLWNASGVGAPRSSFVTRGRALWAQTGTSQPALARTYVGLAAALVVAASAVIILRPKRPLVVAAPPSIIIAPQPGPTAPSPELAGAPIPAAPPEISPLPATLTMPPPDRDGPQLAPPVIIDAPDLVPPPPEKSPNVVAAPASAPGAITTSPQPEPTEPKRMPIRPPQPEPKRLPSIEKKPTAK